MRPLSHQHCLLWGGAKCDGGKKPGISLQCILHFTPQKAKLASNVSGAV